MLPSLAPDFLPAFEQSLDPRRPETSAHPYKVLGYGEISTVLTIDAPGAAGLAFKRMPMFLDEKEATAYEALYAEYVDLLENTVGVAMVPSRIYRGGEHLGKTVRYIVQPKLAPELVAQKAIHALSPAGVETLVVSALAETKKVFDYNRAQSGARAVAIDGQISNWALRNPDDLTALEHGERVRLAYLDTSTPLIRVAGNEQLNPGLFLRSAPSFLVWFIRWAFLTDVLDRYYDIRKVAIDMIANFQKEQRGDVIPRLIDAANRFFSGEGLDVAPLTAKEIAAYYREDAMIWRVYLAARKIDRVLHRLVGKPYPYILPETVKR
jgi:hypothetical protein